MTPDYFTSKWFMTVFSCFLPYVLIEQIFDMFLLEGWRAVFRIGVALLKVLEPELLKMDMVEMCQYFRDTVRSERVTDEFQLFSAAACVRVNNILVNILVPLLGYSFIPYLVSTKRSFLTLLSNSSLPPSTDPQQRA